MEEKVVSKRELSRRYKGNPPLRADNFLRWFSKLLLQVLIFTLIYTIYIEKIRADYDRNFFTEILFVFLWIIISDFLALTLSFLIKMGFNYLMKYMGSKKRKMKNFNRRVIEYIFYTIFRCFSYVCGLILLLSSFLYPQMPFLQGFFAYLLSWMLVFITSRILAKMVSIYITKTI